MKLPLKGLAFGNQEFNYHLDGAFFNGIGQSEVRDASVETTLKVAHDHEGIYHLTAECRGWLVIPCDRCLGDLRHAVNADYAVTVQLGEEYDDSSDDLLQVPKTWHELDVAPLIRDTVLLTIPVMHTHEPEECDEEMLSHLKGDDNGVDDEQQGNDPRWDALKKLK